MSQPFFKHHPIVKLLATAVLLVGIVFGVYMGYKKSTKEYQEEREFQERSKQTRHIAIDRIDGKTVYLIISNRDTLGVVIK